MTAIVKTLLMTRGLFDWILDSTVIIHQLTRLKSRIKRAAVKTLALFLISVFALGKLASIGLDSLRVYENGLLIECAILGGLVLLPVILLGRNWGHDKTVAYGKAHSFSLNQCFVNGFLNGWSHQNRKVISHNQTKGSDL